MFVGGSLLDWFFCNGPVAAPTGELIGG